ncbi:protein Wnt-7b isoform X2 [Anthonomus grandis grandis]|uniref:protein Wnt-7b isoform X2 n=1 Tax=Anthonomus grandis grandis TaxID=2921223 RepID=UPI002164F285|nr:protein Wnt-7b isoform X2 [Anthonomus grandis grandis]
MRFIGFLTIFSWINYFRIVYGVFNLGAEVFCSRIPGLTPRQREMCRQSPDAMVAVGDGIRMATDECKYQFRHQRWNCSGIENPSSFGHVVIVGSREAAFTYAISSAGVTFAITAACARGNISACGCQGPSRYKEPAPEGWKWGGCSVDIEYGTRFARKFMDAREFEGDERSLMNLHNNKAGRKIVKLNLQLECKCHGVSGSCTMKTCWKTLPTFRQIGDALMEKYYRARPVVAVSQGPNPRNVHMRRHRKPHHLVLTKGKLPTKKTPKKAELIFLQMSPNYCERDVTTGSMGTVGRSCNRTSRGTDGCDLMCCGRGYNTHQYIKTTQCRCKFHWCCRVECDTCSEKTEEYTCK